jgi:hypothetical protein
VGRGHHLHPPAFWLDIPVRRLGLVLTLHCQLGTRSDAGNRLGAGGDAGRIGNRHSRHLQQRPGQSLHQPAVHRPLEIQKAQRQLNHHTYLRRAASKGHSLDLNDNLIHLAPILCER